MILDEYLLKWIKTKKNLYGSIWFILIMIALAAVFSYWAGAIAINGDVNVITNEIGEEEEAPWTYQLDVDDTHSGTLLLPSGGTVKNPGITVAYHEFEVRENATLGFVNVTPTGTNARPDFDLRVYGPDGEQEAESATEEAAESIELTEKILNKTGPGIWMAEVDNYSSFNIDYTLTIQIYVKVPIEATDEKEGD
jgi:hypothetical protein